MRNVNNIRLALLASTASVSLLAFPSASFAAAAQSDEAQATSVDQLVVIGTRRTDRTSTTSASPVDVVGGNELISQPSANLMDSLKNIVPSFFVTQNTISDASSIVRAPSLRGLPGDEVLVMLNGKRYNRSALVQVYGGSDTGLGRGAQGPDISAIPSIAIASLQILTFFAVWVPAREGRPDLLYVFPSVICGLALLALVAMNLWCWRAPQESETTAIPET